MGKWTLLIYPIIVVLFCFAIAHYRRHFPARKLAPPTTEDSSPQEHSK